MTNKTDLKIIKLWKKGNHSLTSLARKIGRPGTEGMQRIKDALVREGLLPKGVEINENFNDRKK